MEGRQCNIHTKITNEVRLSTGWAANQLIGYHGKGNGKKYSIDKSIQHYISCHISDEQFIFSPGRDTLQLLRFTEYVTQKLNERA
jgi:hypothetical protein